MKFEGRTRSYVFLAASVEAPSPPLVARKLRVLRAGHLDESEVR